MTSVTGAITQELVYQVAYEANKRAAIVLPQDSLTAFGEAFQRETKPLAHFILGQLLENSKLAIAESRPMCGDTGLPRYYVKVGNNAVIEGGFVAMERSFRQAVSDITQDVQLRANRVHPLTRKNNGNNVGVLSPSVDYSFEPDGDWIDIIAVHKVVCLVPIIGCCFRLTVLMGLSGFYWIIWPNLRVADYLALLSL